MFALFGVLNYGDISVWGALCLSVVVVRVVLALLLFG